MTIADAQVMILSFQQWLVATWLIMPRITIFFLVVAFLSRGSISGLTRGALILGLSMFAVPQTFVAAGSYKFVLGFATVGLVFKEMLIGLFFGYLASIGFWAVETSGFFIDNQRGASIATVINPFSNVETSPLGMFFMQLAIVYFFLSGLFLGLMELFYQSYNYWPPHSFYPHLNFSDIHFWLKTMDQLMRVALLLSSPIVLTMFLSELGLAFANRFAPQLQVFFLAITVKSGVAFLILVPYFYVFISHLYRVLGVYRQHFYNLIGLFGV